MSTETGSRAAPPPRPGSPVMSCNWRMGRLWSGWLILEPSEYYTAAYRGALALAGGIVLVLFLLAIRSKTRYIYQLKEELALLEGR